MDQIKFSCDNLHRTITVVPDWQPMSTAPKDGSVVRLASEYVNNTTGEMRYQYNDVFWGKMSDFPDTGDVWVDVNRPQNGLCCENKFIRQVTISNQYGRDEEYLYFKGSRIIGWTRPWEITFEVKYPSLVDAPSFTEEVYDNRKKRN